jgi:hypothetical protein
MRPSRIPHRITGRLRHRHQLLGQRTGNERSGAYAAFKIPLCN